MGAFWRYSSGGSIWMVQALEPREEYKAARDGMKVMAVMLLLLLVVGVRAVMRMFLSKHTRTSTIVRRVRSWHDTYRLCSLFRTRMRAIAMYYCNSEPYLSEKAPQMLTVYFRKWGLGSRDRAHIEFTQCLTVPCYESIWNALQLVHVSA
jgi:hypothetical protein